MANIPSINPASFAYSRLKRKGQGQIAPTEESTEQVARQQGPADRRRIRDRRRRNIQVSFNRRKLEDRRNKSFKRTDQVDTRARKGSKINTTA